MDVSVKSYLPDIRLLMKRYGVEDAFIFGSAASGNMEDESDVDFLITFPKDLDYVTYADNYFDLLHALQRLLKRGVDLVAAETVKNPYLLQSINENKISVY